MITWRRLQSVRQALPQRSNLQPVISHGAAFPRSLPIWTRLLDIATVGAVTGESRHCRY
jgi:hypothetical protein